MLYILYWFWGNKFVSFNKICSKSKIKIYCFDFKLRLLKIITNLLYKTKYLKWLTVTCLKKCQQSKNVSIQNMLSSSTHFRQTCKSYNIRIKNFKYIKIYYITLNDYRLPVFKRLREFTSFAWFNVLLIVPIKIYH